MSDYETDALTWSMHQAALLRRVAEGAPLSETPDWDNITEEILDVGRSLVRAVRSFLLQAMLHRLKVIAWPNAQAASHWRAEERVVLAQARDEYLPSMRQLIDVAAIYDRALSALPEDVDGVPAGEVPETCPFTLDEMLREPPRPVRLSK